MRGLGFQEVDLGFGVCARVCSGVLTNVLTNVSQVQKSYSVGSCGGFVWPVVADSIA